MVLRLVSLGGGESTYTPDTVRLSAYMQVTGLMRSRKSSISPQRVGSVDGNGATENRCPPGRRFIGCRLRHQPAVTSGTEPGCAASNRGHLGRPSRGRSLSPSRNVVRPARRRTGTLRPPKFRVRVRIGPQTAATPRGTEDENRAGTADTTPRERTNRRGAQTTRGTTRTRGRQTSGTPP